MDSKEIKKLLRDAIKITGAIDCDFGKIIINPSDNIGEGGNGLVYKATLYEKEIAIKFLVADTEEKYQRFISEYFNINFIRDKLINIVNMISFGILKIDHDNEIIPIPYIIMSKYEKSLKNYHNEVDISFDTVISLTKFLLNSIEVLHNNGIIHRDIKPENILIGKENDFYLADFGIAAFDEFIFPIDYKTRKSSRMANISFSAPEQIDHSSPTTMASDIYSIGQVLFWFVFGRLCKGNDYSRLTEVFPNAKDVDILDSVIKKCLNNLPNERFQNVGEIRAYIKKMKERKREKDPYDDMRKFQVAILDVFPECYGRITCIKNQDTINTLLKSIMKPKYDNCVWFNDGMANYEIFNIENIRGNDYLINQSLHTIHKLWCFTSSCVYDDFILIERTTPNPITIDGKAYYRILKVNDEYYGGDTLDSGRIRMKDKSVKKITEIPNATEICIEDMYNKYMIIAPANNLFIYYENDGLLRELNKSEINEDTIYNLRMSLKKSREISMRL